MWRIIGLVLFLGGFSLLPLFKGAGAPTRWNVTILSTSYIFHIILCSITGGVYFAIGIIENSYNVILVPSIMILFIIPSVLSYNSDTSALVKIKNIIKNIKGE